MRASWRSRPAIFISVHDGAQERVTLSEGATQTLHLDQIGDVYALGAVALRAEIPPGEGTKRLSGILRRSGRFGRTGIAATLVASLVFFGANQGLPLNPGYLLVPPLVTFLPGAMLTFGMVELAYGDLVSGSSRLIGGLVQLVLLAIGLAAGAMLVGLGPAHWSARPCTDG
jgi:uncharacterized membrane protein YjjP (DUF1212 family)